MYGEFSGNEVAREFFVTQVELYLSNAAAAALRKPGAPIYRKKLDKRDSSTGLVEDGRLKERSSWLTLTKGLGGVGHWRSASCRLTEEAGRCLLNIYIEDSILYQTIYIHLLHQTDIRQVDDSLFFRKGCLGIYCITGQRWTCTHLNEPIYLQFPNVDSTRAWLALLRSCAVPEIYGRWFFPEEGGLYRMWRQIELKVIQGRNLGVSRQHTDQIRQVNDADSSPEPDIVDNDISCEVLLADILCGRTTPKRGMGSPDWHETFTFSDLPPFDNLDVIVWREKKLFKPGILGSVRIPLSNFRRAESIEGWFPVIQSGTGLNDVQIGELRMKIRIDEEIILPSPVYSQLSRTLHSRNFLDWILELETDLDLRSLSTQLMSLAIADDILIEQVQEFASRDIVNPSSSHQTLFRGNTILTKVMELSMAWYGKAFLEASIGSILRRLCTERISIEVDPARSGKNGKDVERNVEQLIYWCQEFWNQIYSVRTQCPQEMRRLFQTIRTLVEQRCSLDDSPDLKHKDLPWQSVSAFCFLRFIVPAILNPHLFGLCSGLPSIPVQRSLKLIAKVIQSMANLNANAQKESFMAGVKGSLRNIRPAMLDYLLVVSTPTADSPQSDSQTQERHACIDIMTALRQRAFTAPILEGESIPQLPHLLDTSRQLATVASTIARHSRDMTKKRKENQELNELCARCLEIEEDVLFRVSQLASRLSSDEVSNKAAYSNTRPATIVDESVKSPSSIDSRSSYDNRGRPSTAPPATDVKSARRSLQHEALTSHAWRSPSENIHQPEDGLVPPDPAAEFWRELNEPAQTGNDIPDDAASRRRKGIFNILRL